MVFQVKSLLSSFFLIVIINLVCCLYDEKHRPEIHYSPPQHWMNDPNGLLYYDGVYHLFYQYNPMASTFGSMHWGHAVSEDLMHWKPFGVALWPDKNGEIFTGCALTDDRNVTKLGSNTGVKALMAIFTQSLYTNTPQQIQQQSLAYSSDEGLNWKKYENNPILSDREFIDFRDPTVIPYEDHYIMLLAAGDRILFYKSYNLLKWSKISEFGKHKGAHGGVWECPDLLKYEVNGKIYWVLVVSINPGGPNLGSATQYFVGDFNGVNFTAMTRPENSLWLDYGPDCYAGDTYYGLKRPTFIAWMNNWLYATEVPTNPWRGQMVIPRILSLKILENKPFIASNPVPELKRLYTSEDFNLKDIVLKGQNKTTLITGRSVYDAEFVFNVSGLNVHDTLDLCLTNNASEQVRIAYDPLWNQLIIDRSRSGNVDFSASYTKIATAPRLVNDAVMHWRLVIDVSSVELFVDGGLTTMTALFFPTQNMDKVTVSISSNEIETKSIVVLKKARFVRLKSIWEDLI